MAEQSDVGTVNPYYVAQPSDRRSVKMPIPFCGIGVLLALLDTAAISVFAALSYAIYSYVTIGRMSCSGVAVAVGLISALLFFLIMQGQRMYQPATILARKHAVFAALNAWLMTSASMLALGFLVRASGDYSRGAALSFFLSGLVILPTLRLVAKRGLAYMIANNLLQGRRRIVIFGDTGRLASYGVAEQLKRYGYNVVGCFGVNSGELASLSSKLDRLLDFTRANRVDEIFLAFDNAHRTTVQTVSHRLLELPSSVRLLFDHHMDALLSLPIVDLGAAKSVKLQGAPLNARSQALKRAFDLVFASVGLLLLAPVFLMVALAIRLDSPGPVIFRQRRVGFSGRIFQIYKFRSMTTMDDGQFLRQATRGDKRVTRVGRYIRQTSLDELPQLLNVLRGEMSIVGPRPHALSHDDQYTRAISVYALRHHVKPGITGWAQVNGCRGETPTLAAMERRVRYDIWYIKHWSMLLDFRAVAKTVMQMVLPRNVY